jgi:hypothetical protein
LYSTDTQQNAYTDTREEIQDYKKTNDGSDGSDGSVGSDGSDGSARIRR